MGNSNNQDLQPALEIIAINKMVPVFKEFTMYWGDKDKKTEENKKTDNCITVQQCSDRSPEALRALQRRVANLDSERKAQDQRRILFFFFL